MTTLPLHYEQELSRDYLDDLDEWDIPEAYDEDYYNYDEAVES